MVNYTGNLHEKTLELNICSEILGIARVTHPSAWFRGLHINVEGSVGYDSSLQGHYREVFYQFKKPKRNYPPYVFGINNNGAKNQHLLLERIAQRRKGVVFYVFPILASELDVAQSSPNLLNHTFFADVTDFPQGFIQQGTKHRFEIAGLNSTYGTLHSDDETKIPLHSGKELKDKFFEVFIGNIMSINKEPKFDEKMKGKGIRVRGLIWREH